MLQFYHDINLTTGNVQSNPKRFVSPTSGITNKQSVVYLADTYQVTVTEATSIGASTLEVSATDEFFSSGTAKIISGSNAYNITYTGKTISSLTGVSGITGNLNVGDTVKPWKVYKSSGNFVLTPRGPDLTNIQVSVGSSEGIYSFAGTSCIFGIDSYDNVQDAPIAVYLNIGCTAGNQEEFINWNVSTNPIYAKDKNDSSSITATEIGYTITLYGYLFRRDNDQNFFLRLLPVTQALATTTPGFVIGEYRWRDDTNVNSVVVTPTKWDYDTSLIGNENFVYGIGDGDDLVPIDIENSGSSIYCRIKNGFYFAGPLCYFLPANPQILFLSSNELATYLNPAPKSGFPIFVGVWALDSNGFYYKYINYKYQPSLAFDTSPNAAEYQYTINRSTNLLTLNQSLPTQIYFLGLLSGESSDFFNLPFYPISSISSIYVDRGVGIPSLYSSNYNYNADLGTVEVIAPSTGLATSIPGANIGEPVYAVCNPAYAVVYDAGNDNERLLTEVDLNPAFAGISSGYLYLQHRRQEPTSITLSADKPIIVIPSTEATLINLIAYGPIYFNGDYALLTAQTFGPLGNEIIPNAEVFIVPGPDWSGTINHQDPTTTQVTGTTGADGKVNFLYLPDVNYGYYIPTSTSLSGLAGITTTNIANDSLVLPTPTAIDKIYNTREGWLVSTYNVINTDPIYGLAGGNINLGQLPFITTGTPGTSSYRTNGEKVLWSVGNVGITPIDAQDSNGHSYTNSNFNGIVVKLVYNQAVLTTSNIGSYFITFVQRVSLQVQYVNSNVISNIIILEMALQNDINQDPWLTFNNSTQGIINQYRLGWQLDLPNSV